MIKSPFLFLRLSSAETVWQRLVAVFIIIHRQNLVIRIQAEILRRQFVLCTVLWQYFVASVLKISSFSSFCSTFKPKSMADFNNLHLRGVPEYMTQFQNFIKNKQVKIQRKLKYFLKGYEMPFQFSSLLQVVLKIVSLKWRPPMSMQF